ncbi:glutamate-rich protein 3 isoform X3 [Globicephala melas]|uniref:glutamate-rich protein 3 isoform X3 n=1 Tax=Globicephala melas TaxID=9731 RepID=UPI00293D9FBA|nr:glutamate-rich protein 3 isoform X3 [Globicephala melas]
MSHSHPAGLLATYNSLTDKHLAGYFNNTRIRRHLLRSGLITRNGRILSEKEYKLNIMKRDHQKYIRECLAQAIFHKVLDMERYHQLEIKKKLETLARKERIQRFKGEHAGWTIGNNMPILSPRPPVGPKTNHGHSVLVDEGHSSPVTLTAPRPYTAPGNMQPPIRLQPLPSNPAVGTAPKVTSGSRSKTSLLENEAPFPIGGSRRIHKTPLHSNAAITMIYLGKNVHIAYDHSDFRDEIKVYQQHCGGENLCVYAGKLLEKETFQFISKRHYGFPFSLTFFLNGIQVDRLSSCCEYKHRKGSRLGGKRGYFGFVCVERSSPCYKCIIAMGLDKKTTSPKPRKEKSVERREGLMKGDGKLRKDREYLIPRRREMKGSKTSASAIFSAPELHTGIGEVRTAVEEMERKEKPGQEVWEDDQENIFKYEYEEDFEADEEKQDEKANEGQADDPMNGMPKSPSDDEKDLSDAEKESETSWKASDADDSVKDEVDGCSESELEEDKHDIRTASSTSSKSHPYSSCSEDESALGDREAHTENSPNESVRSPSSQELSENDEPGKTHLPLENSLEIETEDQEIIKVDVETKPLPIEENLENVLEEEAEKGTRVIAEGLSEKSREHVSKEDKEKSKSNLWEGSAAKVKDKKAGPRRMDKGVGQVVAEDVGPGCHCHYDSESGVSSADRGEKHSRKVEIDTGAALNRNLAVEERAALSSNKESKQVASKEHTLEKKEAVEEDGGPQHRDADIEEKGDAAPWGKAGVNEVPLGQWKPTVEQPALVGQFTEERTIPQGVVSGAEAEAEGDRRQQKEGLDPRGQEAARDSGGLNEGEASEEQALKQTVLETETAASDAEQGEEKAVLTSQAAALREAARPEQGESEGAAVSEAGSAKPGVEDSEGEASTDLEDVGPGEATPEKVEEAILWGEAPAKERGAVLGRETPLSSWTSVKAQATRTGVLEDSLEELRKGPVEREEVEIESESKKEDERKEMSPEESGAACERRKAERPKTPLGETNSEREAVARTKAPQDEDTLEEEQKLKEEEGEPMKEVRPKEETQAPQNDMGHGAEDEAAVRASELTEDAGPQGEDSLTMSEASPGFEKSLENITVWGKEGGERPREAGDTGRRGRAGLRLGENVGPAEQDEGASPAGGGMSGAPESELSGQAQTPGAADEARECAAKHQDSLMSWEGRDKEGPLQGPQGAAVPARTQEDVPEGESTMAGKLSEEVMGEDPEEVAFEEPTLGVGLMKNGDTEGDRGSRGVVVAEEGRHQGGGETGPAAEREALAGSKTAGGQTEAHEAFFSDAAGEESRHRVDETLGETAAAHKVAVEETVLSREEATVTWETEAEVEAPGQPSDLEGRAPPPGPAREGGEAKPTQEAESVWSPGQLKNSDWDFPKTEGQSPGERVHGTQEHSLESPIALGPKRSESMQCTEEVKTQMFC